jgi:RNA polymerase primary sigma factor
MVFYVNLRSKFEHLKIKTIFMRQLKITKSITNREDASLEKYLQEIGREERVTPEEEVELAQRIRMGDNTALDKLARANLRFVVSVAKQYQNQGLSLPDLINEGNLGLIKAAEKFDETRGFKFISYAVWWIRQSILQAISEQSRIVRLPLSQTGYLNRIDKFREILFQAYEREPTIEELAEVLEIEPEKISEILRISRYHFSLDRPFNHNDGEDCLLDVIEDKNSPSADSLLLGRSLQNDLYEALSILPERDQDILKMYFGLGCREISVRELSDWYGIGEEGIKSLLRRSVLKIKNSDHQKKLRSYLN